MRSWTTLLATIRAATRWNFRWGPFGYMTEHKVRTLPPATFEWEIGRTSCRERV